MTTHKVGVYLFIGVWLTMGGFVAWVFHELRRGKR